MPEFVRHPQLGVGLPPTIQVTSAPIIQKGWELGKFPCHNGCGTFSSKCWAFTVGPFFKGFCQLGFWGIRLRAFLWGSSLKTIFVLLPSNIHHQDCIVFLSTGSHLTNLHLPLERLHPGRGGGRSNPSAFFYIHKRHPADIKYAKAASYRPYNDGPSDKC